MPQHVAARREPGALAPTGGADPSPPSIDAPGNPANEHLVLFYEQESELLGLTAPLLAAALRRGERVIVIATPEHRTGLVEELGPLGTLARERGDLWLLDAAEVLTRLIRGDRPDPHAFDRYVGAVVRDAVRDGRRVQAFGEMVDLLWSLGNVQAALDLETLWEGLRAHVPLSLLCAYHSERLTSWASNEELRHLCVSHGGVLASIPTVVHAEVCVRFPHEPASPGAARRLVRDTLVAWGLPAVADAATFVASELATNAVLHARSGFTVSLERLGSVVRLSVGDASARMVHPPAAGRLHTGGRGLHLVGTFSSRWGQDVRPEGKLIWAEFDLDGGARA